MSLRKLTRSAARVVYGADAVEELSGELDRLSIARPLLLCGRTMNRDAATISRVRAAAGRSLTVAPLVRAHSPVDSIHAVVEVMDRESIDGILALGGGSAIVSARAASILRAERKPVEQLITRRVGDLWSSPRLTEPKLPVVALPTVPTTAIATAGTALTRPGLDDRLVMFDPKARAAAILVDPDLLGTAPVDVVTSAVRNALAMAVEGLLSLAASPFSDALLAHAARVCLHLFSDGAERSESHRVELALAAVMVGEGAELADVGVTAALSHVIGHRFGVANGDVDALLLPVVLRFHIDHGFPVDARLRRVGLPSADALGDLLDRSWSSTSVGGLRGCGVALEHTASIAAAALRDYASSRSPVPATVDDLTRILLSALKPGRIRSVDSGEAPV